MFYHSTPTITLSSFFVLMFTAEAGDWPQILGPQRDGIAVGERNVTAEWPPE